MRRSLRRCWATRRASRSASRFCRSTRSRRRAFTRRSVLPRAIEQFHKADHASASSRSQKVNAAKKLAPGRVQTAISLVGYDPEVSAAMAFVFGGSFICADQDAAKRVTFDKAVLTKSVTLEGDVYDPSGTLSGGAAPKTGGVLVQVQAIRAVEHQLAEERRALGEVEGMLKKEQAAVDKVRAARRELEIKTHEVGLLEEQVNGSNAARVRSFPNSFYQSLMAVPDPIPSARGRCRRAQGHRRRRQGDDCCRQRQAEAGQRRYQAARERHGRLQAQQGLEAERAQGATLCLRPGPKRTTYALDFARRLPSRASARRSPSRRRLSRRRTKTSRQPRWSSSRLTATSSRPPLSEPRPRRPLLAVERSLPRCRLA